MVGVKKANKKLETRIIKIFMEATNSTSEVAIEFFKNSPNTNLKELILMKKLGIDKTAAQKLLENTKGHISPAIDLFKKSI